MTMGLWLLVAAVFALSLIGTGLFRWYAISRSVLDIPNSRSSHREPTPRGGGAAIVITFLASTLFLGASGRMETPTAIALFGAGLCVALTGFVDDHRPVSARWRLMAHLVAAAWAIYWIGGLPSIPFVRRAVSLGPIGDILAVVGLVWLINLYNFMDGIDGIAGTESVTTLAGAILLCALRPNDGYDPSSLMMLASATLGFLCWNFPPAKIFMGDVGSGFLGLVLGIFMLLATRASASWFWTWLILLGVFVVDASVTLVRRIVRREQVFKAHRSHAYQHAARRTGSHRTVTLAVAAINLFWLFPLAVLVSEEVLNGALGASLAFLPLIWWSVRLNAGVDTLSTRS